MAKRMRAIELAKRDVVKTIFWLNENGFETCSSNIQDFGFISIAVPPYALINETDRLLRLIESRGLSVVSSAVIEDGGDGICIRAEYDPVDKATYIELSSLTDEELFPPVN